MNRKKHSERSSLFLIELILSILVLSLCTTVCVRIFAASWKNRREAREWNHIEELTRNAAEIFEICDGTTNALLSCIPGGTEEGDSILYYYDSSWIVTEEENACYQLVLSGQVKEQEKSLLIRFNRIGTDSSILYESQIRFPLFTERKGAR